MKFGVVGAGPWARQASLPALIAHPEADLVGIWARRPEAAADAAADANAASAPGIRVFDDVEELFDAVDAVAFAVPPDVQSELATRAVRAKKHVLLDKPIAADLAAAQALVDEIDAAGVGSMVTLTRRFAPETRRFLDAVTAGDFSTASASWLSGALLGGDFAGSTWRQEGGALMDVGPHVFDLIDAALGPIVGVASAHRAAASDTWSITLAHAGDRRSQITLSMRTPVRPSVLRVAVSGESGLVELSDRTTGPDVCYGVLLTEFLDSVREGTRHACSAHRGLELQRVIEWCQDELEP